MDDPALFEMYPIDDDIVALEKENAELKQRIAGLEAQTPSALKEKLRSAEKYITELEAQTQWQVITEENWDVPRVGQPVILCLNNIVQNEIFTLYLQEGGFSGGKLFWYRDDLDESLPVKVSDKWMPLPKAPEVK